MFNEWPKSISGLPKKHRDKIDYVSDERNNGDGWWIYLKPPHFNPFLECRTIHEHDLHRAINQLRNTTIVEP